MDYDNDHSPCFSWREMEQQARAKDVLLILLYTQTPWETQVETWVPVMSLGLGVRVKSLEEPTAGDIGVTQY